MMGRGAGRPPPHDATLGPVQAAAMIGTGKEANEIRTVADMSPALQKHCSDSPEAPADTVQKFLRIDKRLFLWIIHEKLSIMCRDGSPQHWVMATSCFNFRAEFSPWHALASEAAPVGRAETAFPATVQIMAVPAGLDEYADEATSG